MARINIAQGSELWRNWRNKNGFGASEMAAILGVSPWGTRADIIKRKQGLIPEQEANDAMRKGILWEEPLRKRLEEMLWSPIFPCLFQSDDYPYLYASLDGITVDGVVVEIKTCGKDTYAKAKMGIVPLHYQVQVQQQLWCADASRAVIAFARNVDDEIVIVHCTPDLDMQRRIIDEGRIAWDEVKNGLTKNEELPDAPEGIKRLLDELELIDDEFRPLELQYLRWKAARDAVVEAIKKEADNKSYSTPRWRIVSKTRVTVGYKEACADNAIDVTTYLKENVITSIKRIGDNNE